MNVVFIEFNNVWTRWPCLVCGGQTEKECAHPMMRFGGDDKFLCDRCLASGAEGIKKLAAGPWTVPTMAELLAFRKKVEAFYNGEDGGFAEGEMHELDAVRRERIATAEMREATAH